MNKISPSEFSCHYLQILAVVLAGLWAHGLLLLTDYRLWDGWEYALWLGDPRQLPYLHRLFADIGRPLDGLYWSPFVVIQNPHVVAKVAGVAAWIVHAVLMFECLRRPWALGPTAALAVAMLSVTCPVFRPLGELALWMNTAAVAIFWAAMYFVLLIHESESRTVRFAFRGMALLALFCALNLNSLLVFFYGVAVALFMRRASQKGLRAAVEEAGRVVRRYPDILLLPVLFWFWKSWFTPACGPYANYNRPTFDLLAWARGYVVLTTHFFVPFVLEPFTRPGVIAASGLAAVVVLVRLGAWPTFRVAVGLQSLPVRPAACAAAGVVLLLTASFPYVCVGQVLADEPWLARNNILTPLPMAIVTVSMAVWLTAKIVPSRPMAWFAVCLAICGMWGASCVAGYLRLQAFGVKQLAIRAHMRELIKERCPAVIQLRDYAPIKGGIAYYPPLIWTAMAACCDRAPQTLVFDSRIAVTDQQIRNQDGTTQITIGTLRLSAADVQRIIEDTTTAYALDEIPRSGRQFLLAALPSAMMENPERLAMEFLRRRWESSSDVEEWVKQIVEVKVQEIEPIRTESAAR